MRVTIIGGAHTDGEGNPTPNSPLVVIDGHGVHVDMSTVAFGQLWDQGKTVAEVTWGNSFGTASYVTVPGLASQEECNHLGIERTANPDQKHHPFRAGQYTCKPI
jgi:hypothetical protein